MFCKGNVRDKSVSSKDEIDVQRLMLFSSDLLDAQHRQFYSVLKHSVIYRAL